MLIQAAASRLAHAGGRIAPFARPDESEMMSTKAIDTTEVRAARNQLSISVNAQSIGVQALYERSILTSFHGIWSIAGFAGAALGSVMISANILPA